MKRYTFDFRSIKTWMITAFLVTSVLPVLLVNMVSYYNTSKLVQQNIDSLTEANLYQTKGSLDVWLESYEDILYQVNTDDAIVELVDKINAGEDPANNRKMLRRTLRGLVYTKDHVKSISVITENGDLIFYDQLTASTTNTSWMDSISLSQNALYQEISRDSRTHLLSTGEQVSFGSNPCYLFHMGHRIIDYRNIQRHLGVVLVSIDETLLEEICAPTTKSGVNFIVDSQGYVVACPSSKEIGKSLFASDANEEERQSAYSHLIQGTGLLKGENLSFYSIFDEKTGWTIVRATNQEELIRALQQQQQMLASVTTLSLLVVLAVIVGLVVVMTGSIKRVAETMRKAETGDLSVHVTSDPLRPSEIDIIADTFNQTIGRLKLSIDKQRSAEIAALEAQINPHFLYNTLDTINWMAIDRDDYEISNAITALASILRYGISNSSGVVTLREEVNWLKQYIFLQQTRLKNSFDCRMEIDPELMELPIHKLLLQPFVENAILHGFEGVNRAHVLEVFMRREGDLLRVEIRDNGRGIRDDYVEEMNRGVFQRTGDKHHIGMENAVTRIRMYYGEEARFTLSSKLGDGTLVQLWIPTGHGEEEGL